MPAPGLPPEGAPAMPEPGPELPPEGGAPSLCSPVPMPASPTATRLSAAAAATPPKTVPQGARDRGTVCLANLVMDNVAAYFTAVE